MEKAWFVRKRILTVPDETLDEESLMINRFLGAGSIGATYLAATPLIERLYALKIPHGDELSNVSQFHEAYPLINDPVSTSQVVINMKMMAHECGVYRRLFGTTGIPLIQKIRRETRVCLPYEPSAKLSVYAREHREKALAGGPNSFIEYAANCVDICYKVAETLLNAKKKGLIAHADIKPNNILVLKDFARKYKDPIEVRLIDFGCAITKDMRLTLEGRLVLPDPNGYMAPDLRVDFANGRTTGRKRKTPRPNEKSDVYSIGMTLYAVLGGESPKLNGKVLVMPGVYGLLKEKNLDQALDWTLVQMIRPYVAERSSLSQARESLWKLRNMLWEKCR